MAPGGEDVNLREDKSFTCKWEYIRNKLLNSSEDQQGLEKSYSYSRILRYCRFKFLEIMTAMGRMGPQYGIEVLY